MISSIIQGCECVYLFYCVDTNIFETKVCYLHVYTLSMYVEDSLGVKINIYFSSIPFIFDCLAKSLKVFGCLRTRIGNRLGNELCR